MDVVPKLLKQILRPPCWGRLCSFTRLMKYIQITFTFGWCACLPLLAPTAAEGARQHEWLPEGQTLCLKDADLQPRRYLVGPAAEHVGPTFELRNTLFSVLQYPSLRNSGSSSWLLQYHISQLHRGRMTDDFQRWTRKAQLACGAKLSLIRMRGLPLARERVAGSKTC